MKIPLGLSVTAPPDVPMGCKLKNSPYGLKQASRQWFAKLSSSLESRGYTPSKNDSSTFTKVSDGSIIVLGVFVDDILLAGNNDSEMLDLKSFLDYQFKIKDLGSVHYFLGLEITKVSQGFIINQHKYTIGLLTEFHCLDAKPTLTPLDPHHKLSSDSGDALPDPSLYRRLVSKLNFLQHTRPDISYSVQHLSQFLVSPKVPHMLTGLHVLRYLLNDPAQGILLNNSTDFSLQAYSDSDWAACPMSRRSVTGFFVLLGGCPISWKSKKQPTVSLSSAEAEYRALRKVVAELVWLGRLLGDMGLVVKSPVPVYCDSQAALHIARNPVFHERTKHIEIDCHYVRDILSSGYISLHHVCSSDQLADVLTKSLTGVPHHRLMCKLGVHSPSSLIEELYAYGDLLSFFQQKVLGLVDCHITGL
ncbi:uncharacterized mitochondrial protein AtMg00810-like [Lycium barbarum]|uniref:uncharacterized mitochondrial protein AtMg00810-like n=1 Tax=Lycium barbarum TaxID=112863 RepID=UPI00293F5356|nr:uncharacterized mitochondrial protein AtMg00810-like [Lycium barbarum]